MAKKDSSKKHPPEVAVIMGSRSDWETMKETSEILEEFGVNHECKVVSAHRTPKEMAQFAEEAKTRGIKVIIAAAGGAAHLPGMVAAYTPIPVLGVPIESHVLRGVDSLLSIVQMPFGIPVGTLAIGRAGAKNAALLAISIISIHNPKLAQSLDQFRKRQTEKVLSETLES